MILKKGWFSDLAMLEICRQVNSEEYEQDPLMQIETLNTENRNITEPSTIKQMLTQEVKTELIKKIMTEKNSILPSLWNQNWKKV